MNAHSPRPPSAAHRWMNCGASVVLSEQLGLESTESPEAALGTAAHAALSWVLAEEDREPWELMGRLFEGHIVDQDMLDAVEVGVDACRKLITPATTVLLEQKVSHPKIPTLRGTLDFASVTSSLLCLVDYKHGQGVVVEVEDNPQLMIYAYLALLSYPTVTRVVLRIVQPRAFHPDGPVRRWETTTKHIKTWAEETMIPAMDKVDFNAGSWCRFCPAKLVCPVMRGLFDAATNASPAEVKELNGAALGQSYQLTAVVRMYLKAIEDETLKRLVAGQQVPGTKLVQRRADRKWKEEAEGELARLLGVDAYDPATLKSPARMEKLGAAARDLVKSLAYTPDAGYTVALETDRRQALKPPTGSEVFANLVEGEL